MYTHTYKHKQARAIRIKNNSESCSRWLSNSSIFASFELIPKGLRWGCVSFEIVACHQLLQPYKAPQLPLFSIRKFDTTLRSQNLMAKPAGEGVMVMRSQFFFFFWLFLYCHKGILYKGLFLCLFYRCYFRYNACQTLILLACSFFYFLKHLIPKRPFFDSIKIRYHREIILRFL